MTPVPTPAEIEAALDRSRVPDAQALRPILRWFFEPGDEAALAARLDADLTALRAEPDRKAATSAAFSANLRKYEGQAWRELVSTHRLPPSPTELAIWVAVTTPGYPRPRPYCPAELVGAWQQIQPVGATWTLDASGALQTDAVDFAARTRWCVHRSTPSATDFVNDEIRCTSSTLPNAISLVIREVTPSAIGAFRSGLNGPVQYRLARR